MKKIIASLFIIGLMAGIGIGVTRAYFSNEGTNTGNIFAAGTLDLKLSDTDETAQDNIAASWVGSNMAPGGPAVLGSLTLKNTGTIQGNHLEITTGNNCDDPSGDMDKYLEITSLLYDGGSILGTVSNSNGNGWKDLDDLEAAGLDNLTLTDFGNHTLSMEVKLNENIDDNYQGKSCSSIFTFTLNQHSSQ